MQAAVTHTAVMQTPVTHTAVMQTPVTHTAVTQAAVKFLFGYLVTVLCKLRVWCRAWIDEIKQIANNASFISVIEEL